LFKNKSKVFSFYACYIVIVLHLYTINETKTKYYDNIRNHNTNRQSDLINLFYYWI